jgi:predicted ATP-grasp superfamily ATP-dependent carboligase
MDELIVIGASVRALAFSAIRAGYKAYAIDLYADRDLAAVCPAVKIKRYPEEFAEALAAAPQSPWMYTGALENYPGLIERLATIRPLMGNSAETIGQARDIAQFAKAVKAAGSQFPEIGGGTGDGQWLLKASRSSGGLGVRFATAAEMKEPPRGCYLQKYIDGESRSAVFVAAGGNAELVGVTKQLLGRDFGMPKPFLYVGNVGPIVLDELETSRLQALGKALASRLGLVGLFNVDFVHNDQGLWPVEVNPRYSASVEVLERALEIQAVKLHIAACQARPVSWLARAGGGCFGKAIVYAPRDGRVSPMLETVTSEVNSRAAWPGIADLPSIGDLIRAGQPVMTAFASGESMAAVEERLGNAMRFVPLQ